VIFANEYEFIIEAKKSLGVGIGVGFALDFGVGLYDDR